MIEKGQKIPVSDTWQNEQPKQDMTLYGTPQLAGVFTVNGEMYWCSLILLRDRSSLEFMAFSWSKRKKAVSDWKALFEWQGPLIPGEQDVNQQTFQRLMGNFYDRLVEVQNRWEQRRNRRMAFDKAAEQKHDETSLLSLSR